MANVDVRVSALLSALFFSEEWNTEKVLDAANEEKLLEFYKRMLKEGK